MFAVTIVVFVLSYLAARRLVHILSAYLGVVVEVGIFCAGMACAVSLGLVFDNFNRGSDLMMATVGTLCAAAVAALIAYPLTLVSRFEQLDSSVKATGGVGDGRLTASLFDCPFCGEPIGSSTVRCSHCGKRV